MSEEPENAPAKLGRNSAVTIARILSSAEAEFGSKGLEGAKIDDIAKAAGISKQLIYHYFSGKEDLYSELLLHLAKRNMEMLCSIDYKAMAPLEAARAFFLVLFDTYRSNPFSSTITLDEGLHGGSHVRYHHHVEKLREDFYVRLGEALDRGKAVGEVRPEMDVAAVHFLAVVLISGGLTLQPMFARYTRRGTGDGDLSEVREQFTQYFMRALST